MKHEKINVRNENFHRIEMQNEKNIFFCRIICEFHCRIIYDLEMSNNTFPYTKGKMNKE